MDPQDWIALGGLAVGAIGVVAGALLAPLVAARLARSGRIRDERSAVYTDTLRLVRARMRELEHLSYGWPIDQKGPDDEEAATITARLLLVASGPVWETFQAFFRGYWSVSQADFRIQVAKARGGDDIAARLAVGRVHDQLEVLMDELSDRMRADLGTKRVMVNLRQKREKTAGSPPEAPTAP